MCPLASAPGSNPASENGWKANTGDSLQVLQTLDIIPFGMNTYRPTTRVLKTKAFNYRIFHTYGKMHSKPCTMNTYKKTGGWGEGWGHAQTQISRFLYFLTFNFRLSTSGSKDRINTAVTPPLARMAFSEPTQADHPSRSTGVGCTCSPRRNRGAGCTCSLRGTKGSPRQEKAFST